MLRGARGGRSRNTQHNAHPTSRDLVGNYLINLMPTSNAAIGLEVAF